MTSGATWPVDLAGLIESVTTSPGPDGRWNVAALGLHAGDDHKPADPIRARTWGRTRTRINFERAERGYVQFVRDPLVFVEAALDVREVDEPVLDAATAWAEVEVDAVGDGTEDGTDWIDWQLSPVDSTVRERTVPVTNRAYGAVVEMTVAASRLDVRSYEESTLRSRLDYFAGVVRRCGGPRERTALDRIESLTDWDRPIEE